MFYEKSDMQLPCTLTTFITSSSVCQENDVWLYPDIKLEMYTNFEEGTIYCPGNCLITLTTSS